MYKYASDLSSQLATTASGEAPTKTSRHLASKRDLGIRCSTNGMAPRATLSIVAVIAVVAAAALLAATASAASHRVGDDSGWDNGVDYAAWASGKDFKVGDTLEFLYSAGFHNVVLVNEQSFAACAAPSDAPTLGSGDDRVKLWHSGPWFFICSVEGHCESGMKLIVNVHG